MDTTLQRRWHPREHCGNFTPRTRVKLSCSKFKRFQFHFISIKVRQGLSDGEEQNQTSKASKMDGYSRVNSNGKLGNHHRRASHTSSSTPCSEFCCSVCRGSLAWAESPVRSPTRRYGVCVLLFSTAWKDSISAYFSCTWKKLATD